MPGFGKREWAYFEPGQEVAALTIKARLVDGGTKATTRYLVVQACCAGEHDVTHVAIDKRIRRGSIECAGCTRRRLAREMGAGNRGRDVKAARAAKAAETIAVVIEHGPWAGRYPLLHPMGHRLGPGGADRLIGRGGE